MKVWANEEEKNRQLPLAHFFYSVPGMGKRSMEKLLSVYGSFEEAYRAKGEHLQEILGEKRAYSIENHKKESNPWNTYENLRKKGISFMCRLDREYPEKLKDIPDAPFGLFVKGRLPKENKKSVAIVGARRCSQYGEHMALSLGRELALAGVPVISGMAKGIDGIGQEAAVNAGGAAFAVLGCGVDVCYPASNRELYEKIQKQGGILSEYLPGTEPRPELFPPRNRIISGLSDIVIVVEARQKSGTLITVDMALEQGREIYCVPGRVTDKLSEGCNKLIEQGAGIVLSVEDFLEKSGILLPENDKGNAKESGQEKWQESLTMSEKEYALFSLLDYDPVSIDQLYIQLVAQKGMEGVSVQEMLDLLMKLVLSDKAENVSGCYYSKKISHIAH